MRGDGGVRVVFGIPLPGGKSDGGDMRRLPHSNISVAICYYIFLARPGIEVSEERDDITSKCQWLEQSKGQVNRRFSKKKPPIMGHDPGPLASSKCQGIERIAYGKV
jgi:hypothetical protein